MTKFDFKKELRHLYQPSKTAIALIEVPAMRFLMINGNGDPNTSAAYREAVEALYAVAYTVNFISKHELEKDYVVPPLARAGRMISWQNRCQSTRPAPVATSRRAPLPSDETGHRNRQLLRH